MFRNLTFGKCPHQKNIHIKFPVPLESSFKPNLMQILFIFFAITPNENTLLTVVIRVYENQNKKAIKNGISIKYHVHSYREMNQKEKQRNVVCQNKEDDVSKRRTYTFQKAESNAPTYVAFRHRCFRCCRCLFRWKFR